MHACPLFLRFSQEQGESVALHQDLFKTEFSSIPCQYTNPWQPRRKLDELIHMYCIYCKILNISLWSILFSFLSLFPPSLYCILNCKVSLSLSVDFSSYIEHSFDCNLFFPKLCSIFTWFSFPFILSLSFLCCCFEVSGRYPISWVIDLRGFLHHNPGIRGILAHLHSSGSWLVRDHG